MLDNSFKQILTLVREAGVIEGRKKLQKMVYILQSKGVGFQEKFKYYYYGPYSGDLQLEIDELVSRKMLIEIEKNHGTLFAYEVNPELDFEIDAEISEKNKLIEFLNKKDSQLLELTSTIYFLNREEEWLNNQTLVGKKLRYLKPHLDNLVGDSFQLQSDIDKML